MDTFELYFNGCNELRFMVDVTENVWAEFVVSISHLKKDMYVATVTEYSGEPMVATEFLEKGKTTYENALPYAEFNYEGNVRLLVTPKAVEVSILK